MSVCHTMGRKREGKQLIKFVREGNGMEILGLIEKEMPREQKNSRQMEKIYINSGNMVIREGNTRFCFYGMERIKYELLEQDGNGKESLVIAL